MKKMKRNALIGIYPEKGDDSNPIYKEMKCSVCDKNIIMMKNQWDETISPEKLPKYCVVCLHGI